MRNMDWSADMCPAYRRQHARQYPLNHPLEARKIVVEAVRQQQLPVTHDSGEEEGVEVRPELAGAVGKDAVELGAIFGAEVGRRDHAGDQHLDAVPVELGADRLYVRARFPGRDAPHSVVAVERPDRPAERGVGNASVRPCISWGATEFSNQNTLPTNSK